ncbi:MAG: hypothetical protein K6F81_02930 [Acholeplasmatales bacterium]|nr:hypothetical protein [Acholeplasmatales bacterium]
MKLLIIYNPKSGKGKISKQIDNIKSTLSQKYDVYVHELKENELIKDYISNLDEKYDVFLGIGGDGTINALVSGIVELDYIPKVAIIPAGTMNDMASSLGMKKNINKSLKILLESNSSISHKVYKINSNIFCYAFALGYCIENSFIKKKRFGKLSYYLEGIKLFFKDKRQNILLSIGDKNIGDFQLLFALNTNYIGGYKVKKADKITIVGFKGLRFFVLLKLAIFFFFGHAKYKYYADEFKIESVSGLYNGDGEAFEHDGNIDVSYAKTLKFICNEKGSLKK